MKFRVINIFITDHILCSYYGKVNNGLRLPTYICTKIPAQKHKHILHWSQQCPSHILISSACTTFKQVMSSAKNTNMKKITFDWKIKYLKNRLMKMYNQMYMKEWMKRVNMRLMILEACWPHEKSYRVMKRTMQHRIMTRRLIILKICWSRKKSHRVINKTRNIEAWLSFVWVLKKGKRPRIKYGRDHIYTCLCRRRVFTKYESILGLGIKVSEEAS